MQLLIVFIPYLLIYSTCFEQHPLIIRSFSLYCTCSLQLCASARPWHCLVVNKTVLAACTVERKTPDDERMSLETCRVNK
jgi:hypothetical protein